MADTITTGKDVKINFGFVDGDTRLLTLPNIKKNLTAANVATTSQTLVTNQFLVGDKEGAMLSGILTVDQYAYTTTDFDLTA